MHGRNTMDMQTTKKNQKVQHDEILIWQQRLHESNDATR